MPKGKIIEIITKMLLTLCAERMKLWEGAATTTASFSSAPSCITPRHTSMHFSSV